MKRAASVDCETQRKSTIPRQNTAIFEPKHRKILHPFDENGDSSTDRNEEISQVHGKIGDFTGYKLPQPWEMRKSNSKSTSFFFVFANEKSKAVASCFGFY